jgi:hypothetical protein
LGYSPITLRTAILALPCGLELSSSMTTWRSLRGLFVVVLGVIASPAHGSPAQIIFLRHAEKPEVGFELNERGRARAGALAGLLTHDVRALEHGPAAAIFAMRPHGKKGSVRAIQTMEPAARALGLTPDTRFTRDEIAPLVRAIRSATAYDNKTVIICWEHDVIPDMLKAFGWTTGPATWSGKSYDRLWLLDFAAGKPVRFRDLPQTLLPGDKIK